MLEPEKLIQIVSAWLEYIRQEEMTNAEVEKGWGSYQKVFDEGVRIVGNKLLLDNSCFTSPVKVKLIKPESHAQASLMDNESLKVGCTIV